MRRNARLPKYIAACRSRAEVILCLAGVIVFALGIVLGPWWLCIDSRWGSEGWEWASLNRIFEPFVAYLYPDLDAPECGLVPASHQIEAAFILLMIGVSTIGGGLLLIAHKKQIKLKAASSVQGC